MKSKLFTALGILIVLLWLPLSIPLILIGATARLVVSSFNYGWETTDTLLYKILKNMN